jgi:predicted MPP superfamily phosphohydrolase
VSALGRLAGGVALAGAAGLAWGLVEARAFTVRRVSVPVLPAGAKPLTVLHLSDLHITPAQRDKVEWVASLAQECEPDLVVVTGDNLAHADAVATVAEAYASLLLRPGLFVFGSNDYWGPKPVNPLQYFGGPSRLRSQRTALPVEDLRTVFLDAGWHDLNNARAELTVGGLTLTAVGMDDPHIGRDAMPAGGGAKGDLHLGVVHAPYARALGALVDDGVDMMFAGHTHGGQVCVPFYGALVTNCDLDAARVKGLSRWPGDLDDPDSPWLHVSAGLGTSPFAPVRFACRPEATVLTLGPRA